MRNKKRLIKKICLVVLTFIISVNFWGCDYYDYSLKRDIKEQYNIIKDGDLTYYQGKKTGEYHLVEDQAGKNNSGIWHINPYYNGEEITFFGAAIERGSIIGTSYIYSGPKLYNIKELSLPYCMTMDARLKGRSLSETEDEWPMKVIWVNNKGEGIDNGIINIERNDYAREGYIREIFISSYCYGAIALEKKDYYIRNFVGSDAIYYDERKEVQIYEYPNERIQFVLLWEGNITKNFKICKANTSYLFNYGDCPNDGYFFINDFEYGKTIEDTPYKPLRAGYTFGGWYKEPECINAWDFETDTLPQAQYNEDGQELYQETKLYAKWIKA